MRKYFVLILITCRLVTVAQKSHPRESLDEFFAGVPLNQSFDKWVEHINNDPYLRVDSFNSRGIYSSFKPGIKNYFPFRDSMTVKLLTQKIIYYDSLTKQITDSSSSIAIEGVFPDGKTGRKGSVKEFNALRKELLANYREVHSSYYDSGSQTDYFSKGKSNNFPDCYLQQAYSDELKFYFVMIVYTIPGKNPELKLSIRYIGKM